VTVRSKLAVTDELIRASRFTVLSGVAIAVGGKVRYSSCDDDLRHKDALKEEGSRQLLVKSSC
jgi:hypothetical protein